MDIDINACYEIAVATIFLGGLMENYITANPNEDALDIIKRTKIVEFYYLTDLESKHIGFIADDTPIELSTKNQDTMDTNSTLAVALKAIQQLEARVIELEKQLSSK